MKRRNYHKLALSAALIMLSALFASAAPGLPISKSGDRAVSFTQADFTSALNTEDRLLAGIVITGLPADGTLDFAGRALYEGEAVTVETLGALSFLPSPNSGRTTEFSFLPVYRDGTVDGEMTVSLTMQAIDNKPPAAQDVEVRTMRDVAVTGAFRATDPEGDALTYRLTSKPRRGEVEVLPDGRFSYTPFRRKTGTDTFAFVAVDAYGNVSKEAKVRVIIEKPSTKTTYTDMDGHPAQYAAMRLCGEGVYTGRQIDGRHYFGPDELVNRAEMITLVVRALGLDVDPVTVTGFYDDAALPVWFKPYAQAAFKAGIISGVRAPDGRTALNADEFVTLSQAAAMLNQALRPAGAADPHDGAVPAWSAQAIANLDAAGILDDVAVSVGDHLLTRGEVAMLIVRAMDALSADRERSGLLSWVFGW
ncbi:MAG: Ig-like domain-containing protein [Oscillospiraceae bacterium]|nr:Ig-like domain-containing protein [Oscillospiraceae bacterium]